jgi:lysophospholipase L1-like esterase/peroxiredoxin
MILKRTLLIVLTFVTAVRKFITPAHRALISLLLMPLLSVGCARPTATAGHRASPFVYAAVGDSTGIGLGARDGGGYVDLLFARIEQKRPGSTLLNLSAAGATTTDVVDKQITQPDVARATLITICVGVNDLLRGGEAKQFAANYETLVAKLRQPGRLIVVANLPDVASAPVMQEMADDSLRTRLGQFNKAIEGIAGRYAVPLVDLYKLSGEMREARAELFSSDGLHPSDLGYAHWAEAIWPVIEQAIHKQPPNESSREGYPSLTLKSIDGRTVRPSDYRGKVVLINFWATWCPPCRAEMPALVKLQREYGKDGLQIIGVTYPPEQRARVRRFTRRLKVNYPIVLGTRATKAAFSPDETLPLTIIIDREGTIRGSIAGILLPEEFDLQIKPLLQRRVSERETNHVQKNN